MNIRILFTILLIGILSSCSKEEEASVYKAPITLLQPSTDPANIVKGGSIKFDVRFTNDEHIDSVMVFYQIDSFKKGYDSNRYDSLIKKAVYPIVNNVRKNEQSIDGSFVPHVFPAVGEKIYLIVRMRSITRNHEKILPLIVN
ncbi:MAG: hypothetical protein ACK43K_08045 [Chitinophagales bacterium]|jgi:hypothetical protein